MVKDFDMDLLQAILGHLFQILVFNHKVVQYITNLQPEYQLTIKEFLQKHKITQQSTIQGQKKFDNQVQKLQQQNNQLRNNILNKEQQLHKLSIQILQLQEKLCYAQENQSIAENKIQSLKKRLLAYEQTDNLFQQKDQQISKLHKHNIELQLNNKLLKSSLDTQKLKNQQKIVDLQMSNSDLNNKLEKAYNVNQTLSKQKQQSDNSNKKVINNLKQKIKTLNDRINQLQGHLVQAKIGKQLRERQYQELLNNYNSLKEIQGGKNNYRTNFLLSSGNQKQFLKLGQQINEVSRFQAFEQQIMLFSKQQQKDNIRKTQQILQQNNKLKQKLLFYQQNKTQNNLKIQNDKLKKRIVVMKKRNQQLQQKYQQQIQLLISVFDSKLI